MDNGTKNNWLFLHKSSVSPSLFPLSVSLWVLIRSIAPPFSIYNLSRHTTKSKSMKFTKTQNKQIWKEWQLLYNSFYKLPRAEIHRIRKPKKCSNKRSSMMTSTRMIWNRPYRSAKKTSKNHSEKHKMRRISKATWRKLVKIWMNRKATKF